MMHVTLNWDDEAERILRWDFTGSIGILDYIMPMNDTAARCVMSEHDAVDVIINIGWRMPFPNRHFKYLRQAILAAPQQMRHVIIVVQNPATRLVIQIGLLQSYPELAEQGVQTTDTLAQARQMLR